MKNVKEILTEMREIVGSVIATILTGNIKITIIVIKIETITGENIHSSVRTNIAQNNTIEKTN